MRKLTFGMNVTLDGYIAAPGDDLGWSGGEGPDSSSSDELFQWWSDRVAATGLALYGRKLWEAMSSHWPTGDQRPGAYHLDGPRSRLSLTGTPSLLYGASTWRAGQPALGVI